MPRENPGPEWLTDEVRLDFAASGRVHVLLPTGLAVEAYVARMVAAGIESADSDAFRLMTAATKLVTLCGQIGMDSSWGGTWHATHAFADDQLCGRCMKALGDKSVRAFDPDRPETEEAAD